LSQHVRQELCVLSKIRRDEGRRAFAIPLNPFPGFIDAPDQIFYHFRLLFYQVFAHDRAAGNIVGPIAHAASIRMNVDRLIILQTIASREYFAAIAINSRPGFFPLVNPETFVQFSRRI
jgi:hypothetical protein